MLQIRPRQMVLLESALVASFIEASADYVRQYWPAAAAVMDAGAGVRTVVAESIERARQLGFRDRGHLTSWLDWECEFGTGFYLDPAWEWCNDILQNGLDPAIRVHRIENRLAVVRRRVGQ